jgi:tRNA (mo5U34)-methyltransferase
MTDLETAIAALRPWYQNIRLADGLWTNPALPDHPRLRWEAIRPFVGDLTAKSVLDIGCNAGFFSVQLKLLGAARVVGVDNDSNVLRQAAFVAGHFGVELELHERQAYDILDLGNFDVVLCLGVLYHLRHPLLLLDNIRLICRERLFVQMVMRGCADEHIAPANYDVFDTTVFETPGFPRLLFIEHSINADASNWWFTNRSGLLAMLRSADFADITPTADPETFVCRPRSSSSAGIADERG